MAYVNSTRANSLSLREFFFRPLQALQLMAQRRSVYMQTLSELRALSDRDLADLGLHRSLIRAVANLPDNGKGKRPPFSREQFVADPTLMWGNHVEIDHGNGEISMLAHLKNGSVTLKVGDVVKRGEKVGEMGFSGDAFLVHLHYDLKSGPGFKADGLPSPFNDFERLNGAQWQKVKHGQVDSGDIVRRSAK